VALDDFVAGRSSFACRQRLDVGFLAIDARFVRHRHPDERDLALVRSIMEVARVHGIKPLAEVVHNDQSVERVKQIGVDDGQGYALHEPAPEPDQGGENG